MENNEAPTSALYLRCSKQTPPTPTRSNIVRSESSWQTGNPIVAKLEGCHDRVRRSTPKQFREPRKNREFLGRKYTATKIRWNVVELLKSVL